MSADAPDTPHATMLVVYDEPGTPRMRLHTVCARCGAILTSRSYDIRETAAAQASDDALRDATDALAHRCPAPADG